MSELARARVHWMLGAALVLTVSSPLRAQDQAAPLTLATFTLDTLIRTRGPEWIVRDSRHFRLYLERPAAEGEVSKLVDSLEDAWRHAVTLLDVRVADAPRATVLVTRSRTRFGGVVPPEAKGLTTHLSGGVDVIILVKNDSVRAYTRHEVMHLVARRAWRTTSRVWLNEGLATFADGRCQSSTIDAVARDVLRARPSLTATGLQRQFLAIWRSDRAEAYVLAGSFVDYLWTARGPEGVRRLWQGTDSLEERSVLPGAAGELTSEWRAHVVRVSWQTDGLDWASFRRFGCG